MSPRAVPQAPRYAGKRIHKLKSIPGAPRHRLVESYNPEFGRKREVACSYQVFISGDWVELCRYDSCHDEFHRHRAYWPKKRVSASQRQIDITFEATPVKDRVGVAIDDIVANARTWHLLIPKELRKDATEAAS